MKTKKFFQLAKKMAEGSDFDRSRLGACVVRKGQIISFGYNQYKSHPLQKKYNINRDRIHEDAPHYIHAELAALTKAKSILSDESIKDCEIYVYRIKKNGAVGLARPCAACMEGISKAGIGIVHYTTQNGFAKESIECDEIARLKSVLNRGRDAPKPKC